MESIFDQYLLGHWHNRAQAQSNPSLFAQTEIIWAKEGEWYTSKNFYRVDGPHKPYRNKKPGELRHVFFWGIPKTSTV